MASPRFSSRLRWICAAILALVVLYVTVIVLTRASWQPLPHGGEARLFKVGYEERVVLEQRGLKLQSARDWLGPKFGFLLGPAPFTLRSELEQRSLYVAFASRGSTRDDLPAMGYCEIDLPGGQILRGRPSGMGTFRGEKIDVASFRLVPFSQERLNVRLEFGGETLRFEVRNPAFVARPIQWRAEPLPQKRTFDGGEVTLTNVATSRTFPSGASSSWAAKPTYDLRFETGAPDAIRFTHLDWTFCDAFGNESRETGLFCEPVWKVRCTLVRPEAFDAADSEIRWLGRFPLPKPGESRIIEDKSAAPAAKRYLLGVVGPGCYHIISGKIAAVSTTEEAGDESFVRSFALPPSSPDAELAECTEINAVTTLLFVVEDSSVPWRAARPVQGGYPAALFVRDRTGRRVELEETITGYNDRLHRLVLTPDADEIEIGLMDRYVHVDFFIPAPAPPAELPR